MTRLFGAALLLPLAGLTSAASGPAWRPNVFDRAVCASVEAFHAAQGTGLQRSEVAGTYLLDEEAFTKAFVEARLFIGVSDLPEYPMPEFPSPWQIRDAAPGAAEPLKAKLQAARSVATRHAVAGYQRAGPLLRIGADGTWSLQRTDDGTSLGAGRYALHRSDLSLLDASHPRWLEVGPRVLWLHVRGTSLRAAQNQYVLHDWNERATRTWHRVSDPGIPPPPAVAWPGTLPDAAFEGAWRIEAASVHDMVAAMDASYAEVSKVLEGISEPARGQEKLLPAAKRMFLAGFDEIFILSESWWFGPGGESMHEAWDEGRWRTTQCGRWQVLGPCVVFTCHSVPGDVPNVYAAVLRDGELRMRIGPKEDAVRFRRVAR